MEMWRRGKTRSKGSRKKGLTAQQQRDAIWEAYQVQINRLTHVDLTNAKSHGEKIKLMKRITELRAEQDRIRLQG